MYRKEYVLFVVQVTNDISKQDCSHNKQIPQCTENVFFFGSVISHWAFCFQSGEQEFYRILIMIVLVSVTDQYKSLTLAIDNHCILNPYTCRP